MDDLRKLGPLQPLAGIWEGDDGLDVSFHHDVGAIAETRYRERITLNPFGPVDNGTQCLYGLDYRMAAWRGDETDPFHTEIGYWLWDAAAGQVLRCFMVPRGTVVIAGGTAAPGDERFRMVAEVGSETYGILSNQYLAERARTVRYECTVAVAGDTWSYDETTVVDLPETSGPMDHTDRNTLHRVDA